MKNNIFFIIALSTLLLIDSWPALALENDKNIFKDSTIWRVDDHIGFQSEYADYYYQYYFKSDTLIKNTKYKKLLKNLLFEGNAPYLIPELAYSGYMGAFRYDTVVNKVYFMPKDSSNEKLLFDYTLHIGDTLKGYLVGGMSSGYVVLSIDSVQGQTVGKYYKRWNFAHLTKTFSVIFGIGSKKGLLEGTGTSPGNSFICVKEKEATIISFNNSKHGCAPITSIPKDEEVERKIEIYPNPVQDNFVLDIQLPGQFAVKIQDVNGKVMLNKMMPGGKNVIDTGSFNAGTYMVSIHVNGKKISKQVIVAK